MYLEINGMSFSHSQFDLLNGIFSVFVKNIKVRDTVTGEKRTGHRTMEFPHVPYSQSIISGFDNKGSFTLYGAYHRN
jgi:hypothetical protein